MFEKRLNDLGVRHMPAGVARPQTNGKLERALGELQRKLHLFHDAAGRPAHVPSTRHASRRIPWRGS